MTFYTWRTKKTAKGYEYRVLKIVSLIKPTKSGQYAKTTTVKTGIKRTRARAKGQAQRWSSYYNHKLKKLKS